MRKLAKKIKPQRGTNTCMYRDDDYIKCKRKAVTLANDGKIYCNTHLVEYNQRNLIK